MLVLFGRGAFDLTSVLYSSQCLTAYAIGLPAFVLIKVLAPAFFARGDTSMPVKIGVASVALNLALNLAFMVPLAHIGPALATSAAAIFNVGGLAFVLGRRGHLVADRQLWRRCTGMIGASLVMAGVLCGVRLPLFATPPQGWLRFASLAELVSAGVAAYAMAGSLLGAYDLREVSRMISRRRLRGKSGSSICSPPTTET